MQTLGLNSARLPTSLKTPAPRRPARRARFITRLRGLRGFTDRKATRKLVRRLASWLQRFASSSLTNLNSGNRYTRLRSAFVSVTRAVPLASRSRGIFPRSSPRRHSARIGLVSELGTITVRPQLSGTPGGVLCADYSAVSTAGATSAGGDFGAGASRSPHACADAMAGARDREGWLLRTYCTTINDAVMTVWLVDPPVPV